MPGLKNVPDDEKFSIALGKVSQGILTQRKNVPAEIRALLGEIKDPAYNISNTISKLANLVHRTKFYNDIHDLGFTGKAVEGKTTGRFVFTDIDDARNYYQSLDPNVQFNAEQFKPFTKLKEKYGKEQIAFKLENMIAPKSIVDAIEETYTTIGDGPYGLGNLYKNFVLLPKGISQVAKTVYSAFTHARNLISGGAFSAANGNFSPLTFNNKEEFFKEVFGDEGLVKAIFSNKPTIETANRLRELGRLGVFNTNVSLNEIRQLFLQEFKTPEQILEWVAKDAETAYHPSCTAKMGTDEMSVVDPDTMKVHGVEGLRVVDASVFPYVTNANIYAPVMMVAERAADLIQGKKPLDPIYVDWYKHKA